jgi:hypothetical protein
LHHISWGTMTAKKKILGVAYGGGHANMVIPVLQELETMGFATVLLAMTGAIPQAEAAGINYRSYKDYRHLSDHDRAFELGKPLAEKMHNPELGIPIEESIYYLGINLLEIQAAFGRSTADKMFEKVGRQAFFPVGFIKSILEAESPNVVVTTNSPRTEKAALVAASQMNLRSVRIEDLYGVPAESRRQVQLLGPDLYERTLAKTSISPSRICVSCDFTKKNMEKFSREWGIAELGPERIVVTGQPAFAAIDQLISRGSILELFPDRPDYPTLAWIHNRGTEDNPAVLDLMKGWHNSFGSKYNLIIKVHPNFATSEADQLASHFHGQDAVRVIHTQVEPNVLLRGSDVVLGRLSTMLTQAAYMKKPLVILDPHHLDTDEVFTSTGMARTVDNPIDLDRQIQALLDPASANYRKFLSGLERINYRRNGTENVAEVIKNLALESDHE